MRLCVCVGGRGWRREKKRRTGDMNNGENGKKKRITPDGIKRA